MSEVIDQAVTVPMPEAAPEARQPIPRRTKNSESERKSHLLRNSVLIATAGALVVGAVTVKLGRDNADRKQRAFNAIASDIESSRNQPQPNLQKIIVLKAGAQYSDAPAQIDSTAFGLFGGSSNMHTVPAGKVYVASMPTMVNLIGTKIYGSQDISCKPEAAQKLTTAKTIASRYKWFTLDQDNIMQLDVPNQPADSSEKAISYYNNAGQLVPATKGATDTEKAPFALACGGLQDAEAFESSQYMFHVLTR